MVRLILIGPPGAGKGTQAQWISARYQLAHIATGDMLRSAIVAGGSLGQQVKDIVSKGQLVDDSTIEHVLAARLKQLGPDVGYVLDGVPRTLVQAEAVNRVNKELGYQLDGVLQLDVPNDVLMTRIVGRLVHPSSGRTYHAKFHRPKREGLDDVSGETLVQRPDDRKETVIERLKVYHRDTKPLLPYYEERGLLRKISGEGTVDEVRALLSVHLDTISQ